jgi:hypothetical protein
MISIMSACLGFLEGLGFRCGVEAYLLRRRSKP